MENKDGTEPKDVLKPESTEAKLDPMEILVLERSRAARRKIRQAAAQGIRHTARGSKGQRGKGGKAGGRGKGGKGGGGGG
jgi:hypothetical protein